MAAEQAPDWLGGAAKLPAAGVDLAEKGRRLSQHVPDFGLSAGHGHAGQDRAQFSG